MHTRITPYGQCVRTLFEQSSNVVSKALMYIHSTRHCVSKICKEITEPWSSPRCWAGLIPGSASPLLFSLSRLVRQLGSEEGGECPRPTCPPSLDRTKTSEVMWSLPQRTLATAHMSDSTSTTGRQWAGPRKQRRVRTPQARPRRERNGANISRGPGMSIAMGAVTGLG